MTEPRGTRFTVLTHGGAGSKEEYADGTSRAAQVCLDALKNGASVMGAVCKGVALLEDDSRFNAGVGSHRRLDGSVEMDAAVMDSQSRFGAVAAVSGFRNPVYIAHAVSRTQYKVLAGPGATQFAKSGGFEPLAENEVTQKGVDFSTSDTVGCVATNGESFAAGLSTGGIRGAHPGRVGDVPLLGCGLYTGPHGAVAATGNGEALIMNLTAYRAYQMVEQGLDPDDVLKQVIGWFDYADPVGLILVTPGGFAGGSNRTMAWTASSLYI